MNEFTKKLYKEINSKVIQLKERGYQPPTRYAYMYKQYAGVIVEPSVKYNKGGVRTLTYANKQRINKGLAPYTEEEYSLALQSILQHDEMDIEKIGFIRAEMFLNITSYRGELSTDERKLITDKISNMSDDEISNIMKGKDGGDVYSNVDKWIEENILDYGES